MHTRNEHNIVQYSVHVAQTFLQVIQVSCQIVKVSCQVSCQIIKVSCKIIKVSLTTRNLTRNFNDFLAGVTAPYVLRPSHTWQVFRASR